MSAYKTVITVGDANDKLDLGFTHIEVWASEDEGGTYREITAQTAGPAKLYSAPFAAGQTLPIGGMTVGFSFGGQPERRVLFSDTVKDWTLPMVVDRLNQVFPALTLEMVDGTPIVTTGGAPLAVSEPKKFVLETLGKHTYIVAVSQALGRVSSISCTYSEVPNIFPPDVHVHGVDTRIPLMVNALVYPYTDLAGMATTRYKWRFSADGVDPISEFSTRVFGVLEKATRVPVSIGTARFVDLNGEPYRGRIIIFEDQVPGPMGSFVVGRGEPKIVDADDAGFLQVTLAQGARIHIAVEGSALVREITVPTTPTFDIMTAMAEVEDQFTVQSVPPLLVRRSF